MSSGITQSNHLAHSTLASLEKNKQCNPILQTKHNIKMQTLANKCTQVNAFHSQYSTEQLQHVQKVTFVSRKTQTVCTKLKVGQTQTDTKTFHDIATQSGSIPTNKKFKIHKKFSEVDQNRLISKFYQCIRQSRATEILSVLLHVFYNALMLLNMGSAD